MKSRVGLILLALVFPVLVYVCICMPWNYADVAASDGVLDLRGSALEDTIFPLQGAWNVTFNGAERMTFDTRTDGSRFFSQTGHGLGDRAVYQMTVLTDGPDRAMDFFVPQIVDACEVRINGNTVFTADGVTNAVVQFTPVGGVAVVEIETVCRVDFKNGLYGVPRIGLSPYLLNRCVRERVLSALVIGCYLMLGIYHLTLFVFSRREKLYLVFGAFCLVVACEMLFETDSLLLWFVQLPVEAFRLCNLLICLDGILMFRFTSLAFRLRYSRAEKIIYAVLFAVPTLGTLALPVGSATDIVALGYVPMLLYTVKATLALRGNRDPYLLLYYIGILLFQLAGVYVILFMRNFYLYSFSLTYVSFIIYAQCILLARNYAEALRRTERLNEELEQTVAHRTGELAEANEKLSESQRALKDMIGSISHDLKTPLAVMSANLELLSGQAETQNNPEYRRYASVAYQNNLDLQRLTANLIEIGRIENEQNRYAPEPVPLLRLLAQLRIKYDDYLDSLDIALDVSAADDMLISVDPQKVWSVFDNLVDNAVRYMSPGGTIAISARRSGNWAVVTIADTGRGIAAAHLPHLFDKYYSVSDPSGGKNGQSGMGLYIVKSVMEGMWGQVEVTSEVGVGTAFKLYFKTAD